MVLGPYIWCEGLEIFFSLTIWISDIKRSLIFVVAYRFRFSRFTFESAEKTGNSSPRWIMFFWLCNSFRFLFRRNPFVFHNNSKIVRHYVKLMNGSPNIKSYLLKRRTTWNHLKLAETTWNHPETTWNHLQWAIL